MKSIKISAQIQVKPVFGKCVFSRLVRRNINDDVAIIGILRYCPPANTNLNNVHFIIHSLCPTYIHKHWKRLHSFKGSRWLVYFFAHNTESWTHQEGTRESPSSKARRLWQICFRRAFNAWKSGRWHSNQYTT